MKVTFLWVGLLYSIVRKRYKENGEQVNCENLKEDLDFSMVIIMTQIL